MKRTNETPTNTKRETHMAANNLFSAAAEAYGGDGDGDGGGGGGDVAEALNLAQDLVRAVGQASVMLAMLRQTTTRILRAGEEDEDLNQIPRDLWLDFIQAWSRRIAEQADEAAKELNLLNLAAMVQGFRERWPEERISQLVPIPPAGNAIDVSREWREVWPNVEDEEFRELVTNDLPLGDDGDPVIPDNQGNNRQYCGNNQNKSMDAFRAQRDPDYESVYGYRGLGSRLSCVRRGYGAGNGRGGGGGAAAARGGGRGGVRGRGRGRGGRGARGRGRGRGAAAAPPAAAAAVDFNSDSDDSDAEPDAVAAAVPDSIASRLLRRRNRDRRR